MTSADVGSLAMRTYCSKAGKEDKDGNKMYAKPFKYIKAAQHLDNHPKFLEISEEDELIFGI